MIDSPAQSLVPPYRCPDCGSDVGFRSRKRTFTERYLLPVFLLQPVRCGECFRRDYRLIFTKVQARLSEMPRIVPAKPPSAKPPSMPNRNVA
jgi:hypothetical protein